MPAVHFKKLAGAWFLFTTYGDNLPGVRFVRDYVPKQKYSIPATAYHRALWLIRDMDRMRQEADALLTVSTLPADHIASRSGAVYDSVVNAVNKREKYLRDIDIINESLQEIPEEYRDGIMRSIINRDPFPLIADRTTFSRWKSRLISSVARRAGII